MPPSLRLVYRAKSLLGAADAVLTWSRDDASASVRLEVTARLAFKQFKFYSESMRVLGGPTAGLDRCVERSGNRETLWERSAVACDGLAANEIPFALISSFEPRSRDLSAVVLAGRKPYDLRASQRAAGEGQWEFRFATFAPGAVDPDSPVRLRFSVAFDEFSSRPVTLRVGLPIMGEIEARLTD